MDNKINISELLKDCPKGMELDCTMIDNVVFEKLDFISSHHPIIIRRTDSNKTIHLTKYGQYSDEEDYKCVIFPKGKTTWEGFVPPCKFKDGDVLFVDCSDGEDKSYQYIFILNDLKKYGKWHSYCHLAGAGYFYSKETYLTEDEYNPRFATEEEKAKLFQAIKANGYKWNPETKTLEKLVEPKFKVGDRIKSKDLNLGIVTITKVCEDHYELDDGCTLKLKGQNYYELVPNKFDFSKLVPFESKVLVRNDNEQRWIPAFWGGIREDGYVTTFGWSKYCIPYEGNEHLLDTKNDCTDFYKTWD